MLQEAEVLPHQQPNPENPSDPFNGLISPAG